MPLNIAKLYRRYCAWAPGLTLVRFRFFVSDPPSGASEGVERLKSLTEDSVYEVRRLTGNRFVVLDAADAWGLVELLY